MEKDLKIYSVTSFLLTFRYCNNPVSLGAYAWPDDITKWPVSVDVKNRMITKNSLHTLYSCSFFHISESDNVHVLNTTNDVVCPFTLSFSKRCV